MKKALALVLAAVMLLGMIPMALAAEGMENFQKLQTYTQGQFADVAASAWYAGGVQSAYELGLMKGSSDTAFKPTGNLTVAEALAIACRLHSIYADNGQEFTQGNPWYQVYVDYAVANKIMTAGQLDPTKQITREQFAYIMCGALPSAELDAINSVTTVPDVKNNSTYGGFVYRLYNAGILTGSDKYGTFKPTTAIQRSEVATIVTRMADKTQRKTFTLSIKTTGINVEGKTTACVGETVQWKATVLPENATDKTIKWSSSNSNVASVDQNGLITANNIGTVTISAFTADGVAKHTLLDVEKGGTLRNPYEADGTHSIVYREFKSKAAKTIRIKCDKVISGSQANELVKSEYYMNEKPNDNQEWRFYEFTLSYDSGNENDQLTAWNVIRDETFFTTSGSRANVAGHAWFRGVYSGFDNTDVELYPGASSKVAIAVLIPKGSGDLLLKVPNIDDVTWVKCVVPGASKAPETESVGTKKESLTYSKLTEVVNSYIYENTLGMGTYSKFYTGYDSGFNIGLTVVKETPAEGYITLQYLMENIAKNTYDGAIRIQKTGNDGFKIKWLGGYLDMSTKPAYSLFFNTDIDPTSYDGSSLDGTNIVISSSTINNADARATILKNSLAVSKLLLSQFNICVLQPAGYSLADIGFLKVS